MRKIIGILFIVIGVGIFAYPQVQNYFFNQQQQQLVDQFAQLGQVDLYDESISEEQQLQAVQQYSKNKQNELLKGARGILTIDKIDMEMVIFEGATPEVLGKGIGMIEPQKRIGEQNIGLAAHRSVTKGKQFNRLGELQQHDEIEVLTEEGTQTYEIVDTFVVHQSEVSVLDDQEEPMLTLITCTPLGTPNPPHRLIVQAKLVP